MGAQLADDEAPPVEPDKEETPKQFGDPESYEHLTDEERKAMTKRMKNHFRGLAALRSWTQETKDA